MSAFMLKLIKPTCSFLSYHLQVRLLAMPGGQLRISMDGQLVALHDMSKASGRINYDPAHYEEALSSKRRYADEDIQAAARENLRIIGESEDAWR